MRKAVATICRRLEGLPLALELAAARVNFLTAEQILVRLGRPLELLRGGERDLPARQQAMRATIDWSLRAARARQRELFARLAVFGGGCTLGAVEQVCGAQLEPLAGLLDAGLLLRIPAAEAASRASRCSRRCANTRSNGLPSSGPTRRGNVTHATSRRLQTRPAPNLSGDGHTQQSSGSPSSTRTCVRPLPTTSNSASASRRRSVRTGTTRTVDRRSGCGSSKHSDRNRPPPQRRNRARSSCSANSY